MEERPEFGVRIACELADLAARMVEARYRREHPDADESEVSAHVAAWWKDRPGAPHGDCVRRPLPVDRFT